MSTHLAAAPGGALGFMNFVPFIAMILIFWLIVLRPQQRQAKERQKMLEALKKGDEVVTTSGILGRIVGFKGDVVVVKVDDATTLRMQRTAVSGLATAETPEKAKA